MNRKLKFRVWCKNEKKYYYPGSITICNNGESCWINLKFIQNPIIQQYTGILDRHGYEICEGDYIYWFRNIDSKNLIISGFYEVTYDIKHGILLVSVNEKNMANCWLSSHEIYTICGNNCEK